MMKCLLFVVFFNSLASAADSVKVLGLFNGKAFLTISGDNKLLSDGQSYKGITLIQATSRWAKIEHPDGTLAKISANSEITQQYKKRHKKSLTIYPDTSGMYHVNGHINNKPITFLLDTGATYVAMSERDAKKLKIDYKNKGKKSLAKTASGITPTWELTLDSVDVGGMKVNFVPAAVISGDHPYQVLLGMSYLKNLKIQHSGGAMLLQKKY